MAKYSAEIEILVRGGKQLEAVISQVQILSAAIGKLNNTALKPADSAIRNSISGIDVYTKSLRQAEQAEKQLTRAIELRQKQLRVPSPAVPSRSGSGGGGGGRGGGRAGGGVGKAIGGSLSSAAIGGAFPLLFGQSPQAAVGGAIGGLLGGAGGGFAGSLLGTALGELEAAKARTKELTVELGLSSTQAKTLATAFELAGRNSQQLEAAVTNIQGLGLSTKETASAIKIAVELSKEYGGSVEKIAQSFADTLESGKVSITTLNKFTAQGIPIQDELAKKFGVSRTKLLEMAKGGEISVQQLTDALVKMGREAEATADKGETGFDRFTRAVRDISTAIASAAGALLKILIPALDAVLTKLSAVINRATQAINLVTDAQVGSAESALFKVGMSQGMFGGFAQSKGNIDLLTDGLKTLKPQLASSKEELDKFAGTVQSYQTKLQQFGGSTGDYAVKTAQVELSRVKRDIAARATALKVDTRVPAAAQITDINAPANLPPSGTGSSARKGPKPPEDRTAQLKEEFTALVAIGQAEDKIRDLLFQGRDLLAAQAEFDKQIYDIERDRNKALMGANYESERVVINKIAEARIVKAQFEMEDKQREIRQRRFEQELQIQEAVRSSVQSFTDMRKEQELQLQYGKTYSRLLMEGMLPAEAERIANFEKTVAAQLGVVELQLQITQAAILEAKARGLSTVELQKELNLLKEKQKAITGEAATGPGAGPTARERLQTEADRVRGELNTLTDPINAITTAAAGIGDAFATSFKGVISGSMTAKEALAGFFQSVADQFLDMAAQIITEWIKLTILNTILSLFPGGGGGGGLGSSQFKPGSGSQMVPSLPGAKDYSGAFKKRAKGGPVSSGQTYMVGERGPELFVPGRSGTIVANNKMGGGNTNVVVNVDAKGSSVEGDEQGANQLGRVISAAVQSELIKQQRPGGILAR